MGVLSTGTNLTHVSFIAGEEAISSEAGYPTSLKGTWVHGSDYIKTDADGGKSRLEVDSLVKDTATGGLVRYRYTGVVDMSGPAGKVLRGDADAATTEFGDICEYTPVSRRQTLCGVFLWSLTCARVCVRAPSHSRQVRDGPSRAQGPGEQGLCRLWALHPGGREACDCRIQDQ